MQLVYLATIIVLVCQGHCGVIQNRDACLTTPDVPFQTNRKLPNPFRFEDGTNVTTKEQWKCRQEEMKRLIVRYELGDLPPPTKPENMTASLNNGTLIITVTEGTKTISFKAQVTLPTEGTAPYPAVISYSKALIPIPSNAAVIFYNSEEIAQDRTESSRGMGKFFDLYGNEYRSKTGGQAAKAWGLSRLLDALERNPSFGIDINRIAVTGCSYTGRPALVAGALDHRIALTIPQESGGGNAPVGGEGTNCWRLSEDPMVRCEGKCISVCGTVECPPNPSPYSPAFAKYITGRANVAELPFDHHMLAGLIAPRGLYVIETDIDFLNPLSSVGCMEAARTQWEALGVKQNMGFSLVGSHQHCQFPDSQKGELNAFYDKFLFGKDVNTDVFRNEGYRKGGNWRQWMDWTVPTLS
ncbi:carbohydrate esterase family 15 protein [Zopfia rhizophila CBS 207.26]|uniref:(4-O-methyl)-D-glucuronate--lignin esterase n=1 Tax=Zopfia rhizophila CBS 207.26 TaxID=1314779 RepID=A0A6A6DR84_9PEZI|nr:carbohydrate esterase family 15 protein [Zopfia rhizophila CBS 207.26]